MPCSHEHLQTFGERPNTRKKPFCMLLACKMSGIRVFGAMRERGTREAARSLRTRAWPQECMKTVSQIVNIFRTG